jgi:hypothetical protein
MEARRAVYRANAFLVRNLTCAAVRIGMDMRTDS